MEKTQDSLWSQDPTIHSGSLTTNRGPGDTTVYVVRWAPGLMEWTVQGAVDVKHITFILYILTRSTASKEKPRLLCKTRIYCVWRRAESGRVF